AALREVHGSGTSSRVPAAAHVLPCLIRSVDIRTQDSIGAHIESLLDARPVRIHTDSDKRYSSAALNSSEHSRKGLVSHRAVLAVDQQPVITAVRQLFCRRRTMGVKEQSDLRTSFAQLCLKLFSGQRFTHFSLLLSYLFIEFAENVGSRLCDSAHDNVNDQTNPARNSTLFSRDRK